MRCVIGIDAAWTPSQHSGVAAVLSESSGWRLLKVAGSYGEFCGSAGTEADLVPAVRAQFGFEPDLVAVDMPLSTAPITGRRAADDAVSREFGGRKCGTHSPGPLRPGETGRRLQAALGALGYPLATLRLAPRSTIEVYPHPALLTLLGAPERIPYKVGRVRAYWPALDGAGRREKLLSAWKAIVTALNDRISGVAAALPLPGPDVRGAGLKRFEDMLDAVVCAWVGIEALEGRAVPFGDETAAIWIPR